MSPLVLLVSTILLIEGSYAVNSLRLLIIGDMGGLNIEPYSTYFERCTAKEMGLLADRYAPQYVFELGDNFYFNGVKDVTDPRFKQTFEDVYTADSLQVPWYLIAGNHDHYGNVTAQIQYSKLSKRWNFPDYYYYKEFAIPGSSKMLGVVFIDTILLCGNTEEDGLATQPDNKYDRLQAEEQWNFINKTLQKSKADYLLVAGHFPVYSIAEHGPTQCLVEKLQPMLDKYNVNGYLCGHDHNLQHLQVKSSRGNTIDYYLSGMANFVDFRKDHMGDVPAGSLKFHYADIFSRGGLLYAEATAKNMTLTFINANDLWVRWWHSGTKPALKSAWTLLSLVQLQIPPLEP
ncbi:tartrate-resistant acid phosphatase type 5 [Plakobranchus ocellatus]|uniref:Tartrate-resistant acid phosphatase type 5 n=1 Tax=Plakobranchus ocellatus TaxID=259542 RepID=A0AAV4A940_9GAST|nr:tartrate-resistant acid phosphatase type 5 [Plakobranchus ocellatus]